MQTVKIIENEEDLICSNKHSNQPILSVINNPELSVSQRLLCATCIMELDCNINIMSFKKARTIISQKKEKLLNFLKEYTKNTLGQLQIFQQNISSLKQNITSQFDQILQDSKEWAINLEKLLEQNYKYNLLDEISHLDEPFQIEEKKFKQEFRQFNYSYFNRIQTIFQFDSLIQNVVSVKLCIDNLKNAGIENVNQNPQSSIVISNQHDMPTSNFSVNCQKHNSEIIYFDLSQDIKKEERLKCIHCEQESLITVVQFVKQWDQYKKEKQVKFQESQQKQMQKFQNLKENLLKYFVNLARIIKDELNNIEQTIQLKKYGNKKKTISYNILLSKAEKLSQRKKTQTLNQNGLENEKRNMNEEEGLIQLRRLAINLNKSLFKKEPIKFELSDEPIKQKEFCKAIAFNYDGSLMAAACDSDIKIWKFQNGKMGQIKDTLKGHSSQIYCLIYSKTRNWLVSGGQDETLRLWKESENYSWISSQPGKMHKDRIFCLIMNKSEDKLVSGSSDYSIKIWNINFQENQLNYEYSLDKHQGSVYAISLNKSESTLISCSSDKQILIWEKQENNKYAFKNKIEKKDEDYGCRLYIIKDKTILWQQQSQGYIHIFQLQKQQYIEKPSLKLMLSTANGGDCLFPIVYNKVKGLLILKHNKYVYLIKSIDGQLQICGDPIDCQSSENYGGITNDGENLVIWNNGSKEFKVYQCNLK